MVPNIRRRISEHPVATFFVLTYALSWTVVSHWSFCGWVGDVVTPALDR